MYLQALNHSERLDEVLKGTNSTVPHDKLFDIVLKLMPQSLSAPAKTFGAVIVSVLVTYGAYYLWRSFIWRDSKWRD